MNRVCLLIKTEHEDKSAPKLVKQIQELGMDCIQSKEAPPDHFAVGWGKAGRTPGLNRECPHNKLWEMQRLRDCGVSTVPFDETFEDAVRRAWTDLRSRNKRAIIFGRSKSHKQGQDIVQFELQEESLDKQLLVACPQKRDFWTQVVTRAAEYRVHAFCGRVDHVATKVPTSPEARSSLIWNQGTCTFDYGLPAPNAAKEIAIAAVKAYGLDFGAVDILQDTDGRYYVLEVNLRPGLNPDMVLYYAQQIMAATRVATK